MIFYALGDPEPEVTWLKEGKEIKIKKKDKRIRTDWDMKTDEYILEIQNASKDDIGEYTAVAKNEKGSITVVMTVTFKVKKVKAKEIEEEKKPEVVEEAIEVEETQAAESSITSIDETTVEQVKTDITSSEEVTISTDITEKTTIEETKVPDKPKEKEPKEAKPEDGKPEFVIQPQTTVEIEEGQTITLKCQVKGRDILATFLGLVRTFFLYPFFTHRVRYHSN